MRPKLKVYFGDLTHNTVGLATEVFPLNIGFVAAYCIAELAGSIEVKLFKYIDDLEQEIADNPPDVLALSNYPWCHNVNMALFESLAKISPNSLRIMGGPNFPHLADLQVEFLRQRPLLDSYIYLDGEIPAANFLQYVLASDGIEDARKNLKKTVVSGCYHLDEGNRLLKSTNVERITNLDSIPSPYLTGLMDPFFDGKLSPMIQTNRGCPFTCTFCHDGNAVVNKVNQFNLERIKEEIKYISARVPKNIGSLFISDLNFGMYKRDIEICEAIADARKIHNYPHYIDTTTGKNSKKRVINAIEKLDGTLGLTMSVQSLTPQVLKNIKRDNISIDDFLDLKPAIRKSNLPTVSEVILGLPGETKQSHIDTLNQLLLSEVDEVVAYTLMMVNGSELAIPEQRKKYGFKTKYRIIPRDFTALKSGRKVLEIEEVVISTNTLTFEDYLYCRKLAFLLFALNNRGLRSLFKFMILHQFPVMNILQEFLDLIDHGSKIAGKTEISGSVLKVMKDFGDATIQELWESPEEINEYFQSDEKFQGLIEGEYGANLMQTYKAQTFASCFEDLVSDLFEHVRNVCGEQIERDSLSLIFSEIEHYCMSRIHNIIGDDRDHTVPEYDFKYDLRSWSEDIEYDDHEKFYWDTPKKLRFPLTEQQIKIVDDNLDQFGRDILGKGKMLIRVNSDALWRNPEIVQ